MSPNLNFIQEFFTKWPETLAILFSALPVFFIVAHVVSYMRDPYGLRAYSGPLLAKFSHGWLCWTISKNRWSTAVQSLHAKYGTFVRLAPDHISVADPSAFAAIYGHTSAALKAPFYEAFREFRSGDIFTTRSRAEHARKRRMESHMFAPQSVRALEITTRVHVQEMVRQWDALCKHADEASGGSSQGMMGSSAWKVRNGRVWFSAMPWFSFWSFDTIGDLAFGLQFGMLCSGKDTVKVPKSNADGLQVIAGAVSGNDKSTLEMEDVPLIETLVSRTEVLTCLAVLPARLRPIVGRLPQFRWGYSDAAPKMVGLSVAAIAQRLAKPQAREDMLRRLLEARDDDGNPLSPDELGGEAFILIIAGADTTANTSCAITWYLAREQRVQAKLQAALDAALGPVGDDVVSYEAVKDLPYLNAVVNEGLRLYTTIGGGLPRIVPAGGMTILGRHFKEGTCVSVPTYTMHLNEAVWGENVNEFYPERWLDADAETKARMQQCFAPFSVGPRACLGRNFALMQLHVLIATLFHRYHVVLESDGPLEVQDNLIRKPVNAVLGLKRRFV